MVKKKLIIGITQGDSNGIGYEVILKALADSRINEIVTPVVYGSPKIWGFYKKQCAGLENFSVHVTQSAQDLHQKMVNLIPCVSDELELHPGRLTLDGSKAAFQALQRATDDLKAGLLHALVTAPFNKGGMHKEGEFPFPGHTEYLANKFNAKEALMLLCSQTLKVGVVTGHIPIEQVAGALSKELIISKINMLNATLRTDFTVAKPKIAVLGLNPHAGDKGVLGTQEQDIIIPAIGEAAAQGVCVFGPFSADGFFACAEYRKYDAVLAMYHDQGLIPFKALSFYSGVNFTAGLPIVRTSPDHGTAYDIAGGDLASPESMMQALYMAIDIYRARQQHKEWRANPLAPFKSE